MHTYAANVPPHFCFGPVRFSFLVNITLNLHLKSVLATSMAMVDMSEMVRGVQSIIAYDFNDHLILWEALQAAGSCITSAGTRRFPNGNKRLAILGDTILKLVLVSEWYESADTRGMFFMPC